MEKLNSDEKMSILMKLEGKEISRVCQSSKTLQKICTDERYNPLWRNKIKEEFNTDYKDTQVYDEFKFLYRLKNIELHVVKVNTGDNVYADIFYTRRAAFDDMIKLAYNNDYRYGEENFKQVIEQNIYDFFLNVNVGNKNEVDEEESNKYYIGPGYYIQYEVKKLQF